MPKTLTTDTGYTSAIATPKPEPNRSLQLGGVRIHPTRVLQRGSDCEAALRPNLKTVSKKMQGQLDLQALHRIRSRLVSCRTATINQIRAFLIEQRITVRKRLKALKNSFETILEEREDEISPRMRSILTGLYGGWIWMDDRIDKVSPKIEEISRTEENCINVVTVPRIGPMTPRRWLRQYSTGGRTILDRTSKQRLMHQETRLL